MLDRATDLPVSIDLENGFGAASPRAPPMPSGGPDFAGGRRGRLGLDRGLHPDYPNATTHAAERIAAAAELAHGLDAPFMLTARAENHIRGNPDLDDTITRLRAYEEAGADVLYAPGLESPHDIRTVCDAVSKPLNVLALPGMTLSEIAGAGARRVSVGGGLAWVAIRAMADAASRPAVTGAPRDLCPWTSPSTTGSPTEPPSRPDSSRSLTSLQPLLTTAATRHPGMNQRRRTTPRAQGIPRKGPSRTAARDRSFHAASRLTRWVVAGAVGLTALFTAAAAAAFSGHTATATGLTPGRVGDGTDAGGTGRGGAARQPWATQRPAGSAGPGERRRTGRERGS